MTGTLDSWFGIIYSLLTEDVVARLYHSRLIDDGDLPAGYIAVARFTM